MLEKATDYYGQILFAPEPPGSYWDGLKAFLAVFVLGIAITALMAAIVSRIMGKTHREEIATLMRSQFAWGWAFAVCAIVQGLDVVYLWYHQTLGSFAAAVPLLLNVIALSCVGLIFYAQVRTELRRMQQIVNRTNEAR